jgi:hypothetical protein
MNNSGLKTRLYSRVIMDDRGAIVSRIEALFSLRRSR